MAGFGLAERTGGRAKVTLCNSVSVILGRIINFFKTQWPHLRNEDLNYVIPESTFWPQHYAYSSHMSTLVIYSHIETVLSWVMLPYPVSPSTFLNIYLFFSDLLASFRLGSVDNAQESALFSSNSSLWSPEQFRLLWWPLYGPVPSLCLWLWHGQASDSHFHLPEIPKSSG